MESIHPEGIAMTRASRSRTPIRARLWPVVASTALALLAIGGATAQAQTDSADLGLTAGQPMVSTVNPSVVSTFWNIVNRGPSNANNVVLVVTLPAGTSLTSAFVQAGIPACTFDDAVRQVSCTIGPLDAGITTSASVTITNTGNPAGAQLTVQARVGFGHTRSGRRRQQRSALDHSTGRPPPDDAHRSVRQPGAVTDAR